MQQPKEIQQELKRMREISDNLIIISDFSHSSKQKKKTTEIINISDASHSSKKDKKLLDHQNKKNTQNQKDLLEISKEKVRELTVPVKSQNWLAFKAKVIFPFFFIFWKFISFSKRRRKTKKATQKVTLKKSKTN